MGKKQLHGDDSGTVYPHKNKEGKVTGYRGLVLFTPEGVDPTSSRSSPTGRATS